MTPLDALRAYVMGLKAAGVPEVACRSILDFGEAIEASVIPPLPPKLRLALLSIRDHGYQPMYNGRPSCPFCLQFVDDEEQHSPGCVLITTSLEAGHNHDEYEHLRESSDAG